MCGVMFDGKRNYSKVTSGQSNQESTLCIGLGGYAVLCNKSRDLVASLTSRYCEHVPCDGPTDPPHRGLEGSHESGCPHTAHLHNESSTVQYSTVQFSSVQFSRVQCSVE